MSDSTPTEGSNGGSNHKEKKQQFSKPGVTPGMTDARLESMVTGLDKSIRFVYGSPHQIEKFLRARKAIVDWVGTSKEYKNSMHDYLTEGTEPEFKEPEEPTPAREGDPISKPQMEKHSIKLRKCLSDEEDWEESKGRSFRTIVQLCTIALQNKLESEAKCSDLKRECDVNGLLELIKELLQPGTRPKNGQQHDDFALHWTKWCEHCPVLRAVHFTG